ncbi:MAG: serine hydrolase [Candidatus Levybacteria bacterium]|nr:serine hydrolase [Candidatus Levybacteria bacterium]
MELKNIFKLYISLLVILLIGIFVFLNKNSPVEKDNIISPLPNFLTAFANDQISTLNLWHPIFEKFGGSRKLEAPNITAKSALVYNLTKQKVLFSKNPTQKLPMASLTKIMTAIIALETQREDDRYEVYAENLVGENSMGLTEGETLSLEEILYGLILLSGNDAAEVLASNYIHGRDKFVEAMNNKAKSLGLKNTNFTNPTGLEGDGDQYTTTQDLLVITSYALKFPLFKEVVRTFIHEIPLTLDHKAFYLQNETNLISSYPGVFGVKDGYTPEAGLCLVTYLHYKGHDIIAIILGSDNRRQEMKDLLDYGLESLSITPPPHG